MACRIPSYRRQKTKSVDRAFVELGGIRHYLGTYNSPESRAKYGQLIAEWTSSGGHLTANSDEITVNELIARFWTFAETYYCRADGSPTNEQHNCHQALRPLVALYATPLVCEFGARRLKTVRDRMIQTGWCRTNVTKATGRLRRLFRWGVENEIVPVSVYQSLTARPSTRSAGGYSSRGGAPIRARGASRRDTSPLRDTAPNRSIRPAIQRCSSNLPR
jgi:hypothetical protein